jgi:hypothetical protein
MMRCDLRNAAVAAALSGCGAGSAGSSTAVQPAAARAARVAGSPPPAVYRGPKRRGWISPAVKKSGRVVYVAASSEVLIFPEDEHNPKPSGEITDGISSAYGLCIDRNGNLYVANQYDNTVAEYARGSTSPSVVYSQDLARPLYPIVDAQGDLFVGNADDGRVVEYVKGSTEAHEVLQTPGDEADGMDFDAQGNLYVAYRTGYEGSGSIEKFAPGSTQGQVIGMSLNQPQGVQVSSEGTIMAVETGGTDRIDVFPPGYTVPVLEDGVPQVPTELALTRNEHKIFVSSFSTDLIYVSPYPLLNPNGSPNVLHEKIDANGYGIVQGIALSNGKFY